MSISTFSSREFARDAAAIKRAAKLGPVIITERGKPALAVLRIEDYYRLSGESGEPSLLEAMRAIAGGGGVGPEMELPSRRAGFEHRIPSFDDETEG